MVTSWPKNLPGLGVGAERIARAVTAMSDGQLTIKLYAGGELVPALTVFDAVADGKADLYHSAEAYWQGKHPAYPLFTNTPFGMTTSETVAWLLHGGGQALWDELSLPFGIKPLPGGCTGAHAGIWLRKPLRSLADLRGLRIRSAGFAGEIFQMIGATPVTKSASEVFLAFSQGNVDAVDWMAPKADMAVGFHEISGYYFGPSMMEGGGLASLGVNLDVWRSLTPAQQAILTSVGISECGLMLAENTLGNGQALTALQARGITLQPFPADVVAAAAVASRQLYARLRAKNPLTRRIVDSMGLATRLMAPWTEASDLAYTQTRQRQRFT